MSSDGQGDTVKLSKDDDTPAATLSEGIPGTSSIDETLKNAAQNTPLTTACKSVIPLNCELEDNVAEIETIIEKKLPIDKEKALDADSEDFELKWDEDADPSEDQADENPDIDLDSKDKKTNNISTSLENESQKDSDNVDKDVQASTEKDLDTLETGTGSTVKSIEDDLDTAKDFDTADTNTGTDSNLKSIQKDLERTDEDTHSALKSIENVLEKNFDTIDKELQSTCTSVDEGVESVSKETEMLASIEEDSDVVGKNKETMPSSIDKSIDKADKEVESVIEKNLHSADQVTDYNDSPGSKIDEKSHINTGVGTNAMDVDNFDKEAPTKSVDDVSMHSMELSKTNVPSKLEGEIFNTESAIKTNLEIKPSPTGSESNSLDEQLVYSDAEVPDIEDKGLINEIDSQITDNNKNIDEIETMDTERPQTLPESSSSQEKAEEVTCQKELSKMDVDDLNDSNIKEKSDLNVTSSQISDMDTSVYDINNEHGLDKPDVMIEIPTQELIESFDDSGDVEPFDDCKDESDKFDNNHKDQLDKFDNVVSNKPDLIENTGENSQHLTESHSHEDVTNTVKGADKDDANKTFDELPKEKIGDTINKNKTLDDTAKEESMDVDGDTPSKDTDKSVEEKISEGNSNLEIIKADQENIAPLEEKLNHTDIILEANSEPNSTTSAVPQPETEKNDPSSEILEHKMDKAKIAVDAQPSTSNHQELSDEDQEATDSLGLLAESSRVMDDDDEQEQEPEDEDDDDDFDQDDESNQMTAEHSEDSNAQHSETDAPKEAMDVDESNDGREQQLQFPAQSDDLVVDDESHGAFEDSNDVDVSNQDNDFQIQIAEVTTDVAVEAVVHEGVEADEQTQDSSETEKAVASLLEDKAPEDSTEVVTVVSPEETVKLSDSDSDGPASAESSKLRNLLIKEGETTKEVLEAEKKSPSKTKKLEISKPKHEINIVELEESSSEDDIQVLNKEPVEPPASPSDVTSVNIPSEVEVMSAAAGAPSAMRQRDGEVVISGLPKPAPHRPTRLNTDEVTIKTGGPSTEPLVIPEATAPKTPETKTPIDLGLEIFSLDSDDDETEVKSKRRKRLTAVEIDKARESNKCINMQCTSDGSVPLVPASASAAVYFAANPQRGGGLCLNCAQRVTERSEKLIEGVKDLTPFLRMDMCLIREEFVEISDSDSDDESNLAKKDDEVIGEEGGKFLEEHLADVFNDAWKKYDMEARLLTAQDEINLEVGHLEEECKKIDEMLHECQRETDKLRSELYDTFADERKELPPITIYDTPGGLWSGLEDTALTAAENKEPRQQKRRLPPPPDPPAKRPPIPLGYTPLDSDANKIPQESKPVPAPAPQADAPPLPEDDNADISVVKLSVESAPAGLPPPGTATRPPLRPNMLVYAMRNTFGAWHKVRIVEVQPKIAGQFTMCRVRFEHPKNTSKLLPARCLAYEHAPDVRLTIGTRVVALFKDHRISPEKKEEAEKKEAYYSGIVAEIPNPVNNYRYLIFFDDGYAQYVQHAVTRLVCECAPRVWDEVHPFSRQFVRDYLRTYPERPMVRLHAGQSIKTEWNGKWWPSKVLQVDASLVHVLFEGKKEAGGDKTEWIYRGSTRLAPLYLELQAAERQRARPLPRAQAGRRFNMPYVEYTRSDEQDKPGGPAPAPAPQPQTPAQLQAQMEQEIRRQRAVAKKSTALPPPASVRDNVTSRVVFYTPKNAIKPHKMVPHTCSPKCKRTDVLALKDLRTYNPLTKPLLSGWERQQVRYKVPAVKAIMYRAPCGRRIRDYKELHQYLQAIESDMGVDLFDFNPSTHCLAEFLLNKCIISKKDLSHGKENVPVPCVNYYDDSLPEFCSYNTERTPTAGVPLNLDPEFLCGCDCTDDCADKTKCACWKMTLEGARTIGLDTDEVGYVYKRLPEPLPSGIYECNSRCKCKQTCLNRVAQHPLQLKLQVFKTANRGWGIRALNDVPKGAFLCVYAGNLLTDATANLDGLNEGDEYLAELDYIEVVEQMKEGFEEDIPEDAKKLDEEEQSSSSSEEEEGPRGDADDDFRPALPAGQYTPSEYSKRLRKREKSKKAKEKEVKEKKEKEQKEKDGNSEDCITISDDEELREPARFAAQAGMGGKEFVSKYKSVRAHFGKDEACYIVDAKVQGNIGRYLNHSCAPNVFVQNVFVDTHDPRFPWVAFFALSQIRAGTELTWNYNYDVGSVPGKVLYCYCNAANCRGRLL